MITLSLYMTPVSTKQLIQYLFLTFVIFSYFLYFTILDMYFASAYLFYSRKKIVLVWPKLN